MLKNPLLLQGDVLERLAQLPPDCISCVVTSPPYWSLRKYDAPDDAPVWGGDPECAHEWGDIVMGGESFTGAKRWNHGDSGRDYEQNGRRQSHAILRSDDPDAWQKQTPQGQFCTRSGPWRDQRGCGAWRGQYGLEPTPELYVSHTLDVLRAIWRVLRPDGVVWWNIGDGYAGGSVIRGDGKWPDKHDSSLPRTAYGRVGTLKPKDLILMPERVALAAQQDGWWVRQKIVWSKTNPMPESAGDRPTTSHEYVLMLTRSARYWYDADAVREKAEYGRREWSDVEGNMRRLNGSLSRIAANQSATVGGGDPTAGRNLRSVWTFPTAQTPEAHFATFPEELPRRCIAASCPGEICVTCGHARERIVEHERVPDTKTGRLAFEGNRHIPGRAEEPTSGNQNGAREFERIASTTTTGWTSCECNGGAPTYQPGFVLDPFAGIGTTGVVALRLRRRFIGIELSQQYAAMAEAKMATWWRTTKLVEPERDERQAVLPL